MADQIAILAGNCDPRVSRADIAAATRAARTAVPPGRAGALAHPEQTA